MTRKTYNAVGVMSGTSLDGIDLCWAEFSKKEAWSFRILAAETLLYSEDMKARLSTSIALKADQLNQLNYDYTTYLGCEINNFIQKHSIINLDAVCSHGHTVFHQPEKGLTLQIGNLPQLADYIQHIKKPPLIERRAFSYLNLTINYSLFGLPSRIINSERLFI